VNHTANKERPQCAQENTHCKFIVLLTEVVISVRNSSTLAEQGGGVVMVRCRGTQSVKWLRVYRAPRFNFVGSKRNKMGEDTHSHTCLSGQLGSVEMLTLVPLGRTAW